MTYILWFFLGAFGVHHFYMDNVRLGIVYLMLGTFGWTFFWLGLGVFGIPMLATLGLLLLWDLFTIPRQLVRREELVKQELLAQLRWWHC